MRRLLTGMLLALALPGLAAALDVQRPEGALLGYDLLDDDYTIADVIGEHEYEGRCPARGRQGRTMRGHAEAVSESFGVSVKACNCLDEPGQDDRNCNDDFNAYAHAAHRGVIWYSDTLVDVVETRYGDNADYVLPLIVAHEIGHLVHFEIVSFDGWPVPPAPTVPPPSTSLIELSLEGLLLLAVTGPSLFLASPVGCAPTETPLECAQWFHRDYQVTLQAKQAAHAADLRAAAQRLLDSWDIFKDWQDDYEADQLNADYGRRLEQVADCFAGYWFADSASDLGEREITDVMDMVIEAGAEMSDSTHPTDLDRVTATYHGVAGAHFGVVGIVGWCLDFIGIDTRSDDLEE